MGQLKKWIMSPKVTNKQGDKSLSKGTQKRVVRTLQIQIMITNYCHLKSQSSLCRFRHLT